MKPSWPREQSYTGAIPLRGPSGMRLRDPVPQNRHTDVVSDFRMPPRGPSPVLVTDTQSAALGDPTGDLTTDVPTSRALH